MAYLHRCAAEPWAWGAARGDCTLFAAGWVEAGTGWHPCPDLINAYHDEAGASATIARLGGVEAAVTARLGAPLGNPLLAQRGDVVLVAAADLTERLGIHLGETLAVKCPRGVGQVVAGRAVRVWAVGRR
jgi:hypothetical protein